MGALRLGRWPAGDGGWIAGHRTEALALPLMPKYKKPALAEILAEVRYESLSDGSAVSAAHLLANAWQGSVEMDVRPRVSEQGPAEAELRPWLKVWPQDRVKLFQATEGMIVANLVGDYPGWSVFRAHLDECIAAVGSVAAAAKATSVNLRTIDNIDAPREGFIVSDYLATDGPYIPT